MRIARLDCCDFTRKLVHPLLYDQQVCELCGSPDLSVICSSGVTIFATPFHPLYPNIRTVSPLGSLTIGRVQVGFSLVCSLLKILKTYGS